MTGAAAWDCADIARWLGDAARSNPQSMRLSYNTTGLPTFTCSPEAYDAASSGDDSALEREFRAHVQAHVRF